MPEVAVLVLTMFDDDESVFVAMRAGVRGYVVEGAEQEELGARCGLSRPGGDLRASGRRADAAPIFTAAPVAADPFPELTAREREILDLLTAA